MGGAGAICVERAIVGDARCAISLRSICSQVYEENWRGNSGYSVERTIGIWVGRGDRCNGNPSGKDLTYAWTGVFGGGNLRDSQGEIITTTFNNSTYRLDNWCPFFRITL
jgi:hypothetical protein